MEPVFQESTSKFTNKKLMETVSYLEKENEDLRERIYDLENSVQIHKNIVSVLSDTKSFDPQARYYTQQLNQESELLHARIEKLTEERNGLRSQIVMYEQMKLSQKDYVNEEIIQLKDEIEEMKGNLDRKEYLLQYTEQRNTEMEKLLKKRAMHDEVIRKRLESLSIEPDKDRTITNVVEDCTRIQERNNELEKENKKLREELDYALSNGVNNNEMTIFANNIRPVPNIDDLNRIKSQSSSKDLYLKKLEDMVVMYMSTTQKVKDELTKTKTESNLLKDRVQYFDNLNEKLKKAVVKYKTKCEELEQKISDKNVKVWVKENTGVQRVKASDLIRRQINSDEEQDDKELDEIDIKIDVNDNHEDKEENLNNVRVEDEFAPQDDSPTNENKGGIMLDKHFPDESTIVINVDHEENDSLDGV